MGAESRLVLRNALPADVEMIYQLRNADDVRSVSRRQHALDHDEFEQEILTAINHRDAEVLVIEVGDAVAGYVRIEPYLEGYEIGLALERAHRGHGLGPQAIRMATDAFLELHPGVSLVALTRRDNVASGRAFEAAGFKPDGEEGELLAYRYTLG
jgi:RimJ/RimL family protein N-acetyltransferase